jgi:hypothetical protein
MGYLYFFERLDSWISLCLELNSELLATLFQNGVMSYLFVSTRYICFLCLGCLLNRPHWLPQHFLGFASNTPFWELTMWSL